MARPAGHPLGPLVSWEPLEHPVWSRIYAGGVAVAAIALIVTAAWLTPDSHRMGTHQQLGLPPCGFVTMTGLPCPTCGMTTAFADTVRGRVVAAVQAQAAGFVLAVFTMVAGVLGSAAVVTGKRISVNWYRVNPIRLIWLVTLGFLLAWGLKIVLGLMDRSLPVR